jgi:hypothetical protein
VLKLSIEIFSYFLELIYLIIMDEITYHPLTPTHRTTVILVSILPAVGLLALLMGIWHCIRKRNIATRIERERQDEESTLHQRAFLADDERLPERAKSTAHQVPKLRLPNLPNLPKLKTNASLPHGAQVRPPPIAVVGNSARSLRFGSYSRNTHAVSTVTVRQN